MIPKERTPPAVAGGAKTFDPQKEVTKMSNYNQARARLARAQQELRSSQRRLEQANRRLGQQLRDLKRRLR